jgi:DNA-directed RNA polymerase subunit L
LLGYDFVFQNQDHTLGNLLQTWIDQNYIDNGEVTYVGYMIPHPLSDEMILTIGVADGQEKTARRILKETARSCTAIFREWSEAWEVKKSVTEKASASQATGRKKRPIVRTT